LEALVDSAGLAANGIKAVRKTLFMDLLANGWPAVLDKAEGLAIINDSTIAICNDNDFGQTCPLADGIAIATTNAGHVFVYGLKGANKLKNYKTFAPSANLGKTGPSTFTTPYLTPVAAGSKFTSILTTGDAVGGYKMAGIPDGLGAYDNGNGTFTVLMNHEIPNTAGVVRAHGSAGGFVSKWVINKSDLSVVSGGDLIKNVNLWSAGAYTTFNAANPSPKAAFNRFCSADLPAPTAFFNSATGLGTQERIFLNGEEGGTEARAFAHIATGAAAGTTYELPGMGKFSWENAVAAPFASDKTIVVGLDDATPGQVYVYVGTKTNTGTDVDKAGLTNGKLFGVAVSGLTSEVSASIPTPNTGFSLVDLGNVKDSTGASLETRSTALGVTKFLRPEDGAWDPSNLRDFYFVTTNAFTAPSRLWRLRFNDISKPELGGTITAVLDGTEGQKMLDNIGIDNFGHILMQEDVGNNAHIGKVWQYTIATDALVQVAQHDSSRFITGAANFLTLDEESSGIIDVQSILGPGMFLCDVQAHYAIPGELVEGGQLLAFFNPSTKNSFLGAGLSSSQSPYLLPTVSGGKFTSILTTGDAVGGYKMAGIPDGLGAYDNGNGTFTVLMNHELGNTLGTTRAHGSIGAFVSKWVINKSDLSVVSGGDLIKNVNLWSAGAYTTFNAANPSPKAAFNRFCSADLPAPTAFFNSATGLGTQERIFLNGEEGGTEARAFAHIATGAAAGTTYELPGMGKFSWENAVAAPFASDKTIVVGLDDATPGQVYVYVGTKTNTGTDVDKAGLTNGKLFGVAVSGLTSEVSASIPTPNTGFSLVDLGNVKDSTGASLETRSTALGVTKFLRPEDGAWDPSNLRDFYFVTTNAFTAPSRLWRLRFNDISKPELGGTITAVLDGTEGQKMLDNIGIDNFGHILMQEDVGNNAHIGKVWQYTIATDALVQVAQHDSSRFITGAANFLTLDEESSGIIDVQSILGPGMFLSDVQAHYAIPGELVEGGQLLAFFNPDTKNANPAISVRGNNINIANGDASPGFADNTDFGDVERGSSKILPFEIKNAGPGALIVRSIRFDGYNALDFSLISPTSFPLVIPVNGSQTIQVQFEPKTIGGEVASIIIFSNDFAKGEYEYVLQGMGIKPLGITPNNLPESAITVYPNPAGNLLNINFNVLNAATAQITMFDINGKSVLSAGTSTINGCSLNTSALSNGMYTLQITTDNGQVVRKKVVITR
jgi:secreted PhoX family phosphatase